MSKLLERAAEYSREYDANPEMTLDLFLALYGPR